ncbi:MAG: exodeoxyribonuclease VII small subunit [Gammaproteobacteria bacterium]|nr:exodeoxyribonuclease VII small subunit [Gammaproteobacteria bacterium]
MPRKKATPKIDFEKSLAKLEQVVEKLESGDQSLDESLKLFEEGISLTRGCQNALKQAEEKITFLSQENEEWLPDSEQSAGDFLDGDN